MLSRPDHISARELLLSAVSPVGTETVPLADCAGRVLASELPAAENVPAFDRSAFDGYALRAADIAAASETSPVTLRITEEIPAGYVGKLPVTENTAAKILTGAKMPEGADAVVKFEDTRFDSGTVTFFRPVKSGANVIGIGEDVRRGQRLAEGGTVIDAGLAGTLAAQGVSGPEVFRRPVIGILSTGSELVEADMPEPMGKIRNSNRYTLAAAVHKLGCESVYLGTAGDSADEIAELFEKGLAVCDAIISTGGVSVGDYDLTPDAMERIGAEMLFRGVAVKPGMACAYAVKDGKLICGLSGSPASSLTNFYILAYPALKKLCGLKDYMPEEIKVTLSADFKKKSPMTRFLRGRLSLKNGRAEIELLPDQGNQVLSSAIGMDMLALVPGGSGPIAAGTELKGYLL